MQKPIVAIDIDDVLFPYVLEVVELYNKVRGGNLTIDDMHSYNFVDVWGGTMEEATEIAHAIHRREFLHIQPLPGSQVGVAELAKRFELHVVTSRPTIFEQKTQEWIGRHFPGAFKRLDLVGNSYDGSIERTKVEVCREYGSDYLIDDQPKYISQCAEKGIQAVLFGDYAWNHRYKLPNGVSRCADWSEVLEYFAEAANA